MPCVPLLDYTFLFSFLFLLPIFTCTLEVKILRDLFAGVRSSEVGRSSDIQVTGYGRWSTTTSVDRLFPILLLVVSTRGPGTGTDTVCLFISLPVTFHI